MGGVIATMRRCVRPASNREPCMAAALERMEITGEVKFSRGSAPDALPPNSYLTVKFEDVSGIEAPSPAVELGESIVDVTNIYKKGKPLMYSITCLKPWLVDRYSISVVLNVGWRAGGNDWLRRGDYFSDTTHRVQVDEGKDFYNMDIEVVKYQ